MNIIADLWNGNLAPVKKLGRDDPELQKLIDLIGRNGKRLETLFSKEQLELFGKYNDCTDEYWSLMAEKAFCEGFSFGIRFMAEAFAEK